MKMTLYCLIAFFCLCVSFMLLGGQKSKIWLFSDPSIGEVYLISISTHSLCKPDTTLLKQHLADLKLMKLNQSLAQIKGMFTLKHPFVKEGISYPAIEFMDKQARWTIPLSSEQRYVFFEANGLVNVYQYPGELSSICAEQF
jgi:hypothetical protein